MEIILAGGGGEIQMETGPKKLTKKVLNWEWSLLRVVFDQGLQCVKLGVLWPLKITILMTTVHYPHSPVGQARGAVTPENHCSDDHQLLSTHTHHKGRWPQATIHTHHKGTWPQATIHTHHKGTWPQATIHTHSPVGQTSGAVTT